MVGIWLGSGYKVVRWPLEALDRGDIFRRHQHQTSEWLGRELYPSVRGVDWSLWRGRQRPVLAGWRPGRWLRSTASLLRWGPSWWFSGNRRALRRFLSNVARYRLWGGYFGRKGVARDCLCWSDEGREDGCLQVLHNSNWGFSLLFRLGRLRRRWCKAGLWWGHLICLPVGLGGRWSSFSGEGAPPVLLCFFYASTCLLPFRSLLFFTATR